MQTRYLFLLRFLLALSDLILLNMCLFVGYYLSSKYGVRLDKSVYQNSILPVNIIWLLTTGLFRLYNEYTIYTLKDIYRATWRSIVLHVLIFQIFIALTVRPDFPKNFILTFYALVIVCFALSRLASIAMQGLMKFNFDKRNTNILAIASIGGHWIQLLRLMPLFKESNVTFISNKATLEDTVKGHKFHLVPDANKDDKFNLVKCTFSIFWYLLISRPQVIITTGAAPGLIAILLGKIFGIKTIWIDSIANAEKLSLSGSIALRVADRVYTQWEHLSTPRVMYSGNVL